MAGSMWRIHLRTQLHHAEANITIAAFFSWFHSLLSKDLQNSKVKESNWTLIVRTWCSDIVVLAAAANQTEANALRSQRTLNARFKPIKIYYFRLLFWLERAIFFRSIDCCFTFTTLKMWTIFYDSASMECKNRFGDCHFSAKDAPACSAISCTLTYRQSHTHTH